MLCVVNSCMQTANVDGGIVAANFGPDVWNCISLFCQDSEESEEEEFTEEQWKQTEAHKLLLNDFVTIAKQLSTS